MHIFYCHFLNLRKENAIVHFVLFLGQLKAEDFELLCPDGGRAPLQNYQSCNFGVSPPNMVINSILSIHFLKPIYF